jgi:hypothetical protein
MHIEFRLDFYFGPMDPDRIIDIDDAVVEERYGGSYVRGA